MWDIPSASPEGRAVLESLAKTQYPRRMDTYTKEITRRNQILHFWKAHGLEATRDAYCVSRRTLFRWNSDTTPKSRAHTKGYLRRVVDSRLADEVVRLREAHPRIGKEKLAPLLAMFCTQEGIPIPSETTTGRILGELRAAGRLPIGGKLRMSAKTGKLLEKQPQPRRRKLRRNGYVPEKSGDLLQLDGVLTFVGNKRRYTFTAVDLVSRWAYSKTYASSSSRNGADFLRQLLELAPFPITHIQTDNGSEFMKEFRETVENTAIIHFHNWVKQPKYQGWIERFNRTIQ
jgi:putative transposase